MYFDHTHRSYVSFSVDSDALPFTEVSRVITDRQSVLAALEFNILELSQGTKLMVNVVKMFSYNLYSPQV